MTGAVGSCGRGDYQQLDYTRNQISPGDFYKNLDDEDADEETLYFVKRWGDSRDEIYAEYFNPFSNPKRSEVFILGEGQALPSGVDRNFPIVRSESLLKCDTEDFLEGLKKGITNLEKWVQEKKSN